MFFSIRLVHRKSHFRTRANALCQITKKENHLKILTTLYGSPHGRKWPQNAIRSFHLKELLLASSVNSIGAAAQTQELAQAARGIVRKPCSSSSTGLQRQPWARLPIHEIIYENPSQIETYERNITRKIHVATVKSKEMRQLTPRPLTKHTVETKTKVKLTTASVNAVLQLTGTTTALEMLDTSTNRHRREARARVPTKKI